MIPLYPHLFVEIDTDCNKVKYVNGKPLYLATDYHRKNEGIIFGNVIAIPDKINAEKDHFDPNRLKMNQRIYFHWNNIVNLDNKFELKNGLKDVFRVRWSSVFGKVEDGKYKCLHDWILVKPVIESMADKTFKSGIISPYKPKPKHLEGIIHSVPDKPYYGYGYESVEKPMFNQMLKPGDHIFFSELSDWELEIEGEKFFMMKLDDCELIVNPK